MFLDCNNQGKMEISELYDFVIVGGGMIGSSAAKHTAKICSEKNINARKALIGVAEEGTILIISNEQ